jgi:conjugal transfer pilus assembly protein TraF
MRKHSYLLAFMLIAIPFSTHAAVDWDDVCKESRIYDENTGSYTWKGARGKYFCIQEEPKEPKPEIKDRKQAQTSKPEEKEKDCSNADEWDSSCGFVNPDNLPPEEAFAFQSKQRDTLLQNMSVRPDSMDSVVNAQKYMNWVIDKAMLLADMYQYSAVQNPELDPNADHSGSSFAQNLIAARNLDNKKQFWTAMKSWDSEIVLFTRASCDFCAQQADNIRPIQIDSGLPLLEVALEDECVADYASQCIKGEQALLAAQQFNIETVPTTMGFWGLSVLKRHNPLQPLSTVASRGVLTFS